MPLLAADVGTTRIWDPASASRFVSGDTLRSAGDQTTGHGVTRASVDAPADPGARHGRVLRLDAQLVVGRLALLQRLVRRLPRTGPALPRVDRRAPGPHRA